MGKTPLGMEKAREETINSNTERMKQLGILTLSCDVKGLSKKKKINSTGSVLVPSLFLCASCTGTCAGTSPAVLLLCWLSYLALFLCSKSDCVASALFLVPCFVLIWGWLLSGACDFAYSFYLT